MTLTEWSRIRASWEQILQVACPRCEAPKGRPCRSPNGNTCPPHGARRDAAVKAGKWKPGAP